LSVRIAGSRVLVLKSCGRQFANGIERMAKRVDSNQSEIVAGLRQFGASVIPTHMVRHGYPDINVGYRGINYLFEIKCVIGKFTPDEIKFHEEWRGMVYTIHNVEQAIDILTQED
jgi:hypothetical protein